MDTDDFHSLLSLTATDGIHSQVLNVLMGVDDTSHSTDYFVTGNAYLHGY